MKSLPFPVAALLLLTAGLVVHWREYTPQLPERIASHIDASGQANQWTDKATFLHGTVLFFTILARSWFWRSLRSCAARQSTNRRPLLVNVPRKDYWLATPERRGEVAMMTLQFMLWFLFGMITLLYFGVVHAMIMATLHPERNYNVENLTVFGLGLLFIFAQVGTLIYRLYHPPGSRVMANLTTRSKLKTISHVFRWSQTQPVWLKEFRSFELQSHCLVVGIHPCDSWHARYRPATAVTLFPLQETSDSRHWNR